MLKKKRRVLALMASLCLGVSLFGGCGKSQTTQSQSKVKDSLVVATAYDAKSLDPHAVNDVASSNVMTQIYGTLVRMNEKNEVVPMLADSFSQLDELTYEFKLKKGVKFHNGEEMKASDVKFSLERAAKSALVSHIFGDIDTNSFKIPNDYTISFKTKVPAAGFLSGLSHTGGSILSEKAVTAAGEKYAMNPVGTGPFKFVSWTKGDRVELERFNDFYGEKPKFSKMTIRVIPEPTNRAIELESGGVDIAYEISSNDIKRIEENEKLQITRVIDNSTQYLGFNNQKKPFNDVKVRQAISYALNTKTIVESAWRGVGKVAVGPIGPNVRYSDKSLQAHEYNVQKAKELLKEAGYEKGFKTSIWTNEKKERVDMATIMQSQLKEVGIEAEIKILEWGAYLDGLSKGEHDMFIIGWTCQTPDPDLAVYAPLHSSKAGTGGNYSFFKNAKVDELIMKGRVMKDSPEREEVYKEIQKEVKDQAPWVFLSNGEQVVGTSKNVKGFVASPFGYHILYNVSFQ
ncbi:peptide/nickel transport system substrate-binding protein [Clostridium pascui]|uniref:glutathione ABC transporter substrate-binding protein n=1 Tax=Clostridium pascui TaxID=46609 RepID=UPI00195E333A|nr:glutathione ABC transporter substrate-binding protein [Clostridium pascui]MBM7872205.1 peptide/nickel transport system substrate-binding protein [Clostridium pascui]